MCCNAGECTERSQAMFSVRDVTHAAPTSPPTTLFWFSRLLVHATLFFPPPLSQTKPGGFPLTSPSPGATVCDLPPDPLANGFKLPPCATRPTSRPASTTPQRNMFARIRPQVAIRSRCPSLLSLASRVHGRGSQPRTCLLHDEGVPTRRTLHGIAFTRSVTSQLHRREFFVVQPILPVRDGLSGRPCCQRRTVINIPHRLLYPMELSAADLSRT